MAAASTHFRRPQILSPAPVGLHLKDSEAEVSDEDMSKDIIKKYSNSCMGLM